ncbi:MAG: A24 family peptidase [Pseudomonadota bacterium]
MVYLPPTTVFAILGFLFGACIGSFLNVCIYRLPGGRSLAWPPSHCPSCSHPIRFYDNVPIVSYLILMGKCRHCRGTISPRYPLVEAITGLAAAATVVRFGVTLPALVYFVFIAALIVVTFIDIDTQRIFDVITLPGILIGVLSAAILPKMGIVDALLGALVGGGSLYLVAWMYIAIKKQEGMGGGDIKLLAMIGAFLGWKGVIMTIFVGSVTGTVAGLLQMTIGRRLDGRLRIPFGPFLAIGAVTYLFYGDELFHWYLTLFR